MRHDAGCDESFCPGEAKIEDDVGAAGTLLMNFRGNNVHAADQSACVHRSAHIGTGVICVSSCHCAEARRARGHVITVNLSAIQVHNHTVVTANTHIQGGEALGFGNEEAAAKIRGDEFGTRTWPKPDGRSQAAHSVAKRARPASPS
jgi:hypothetical protein